MANTARSEALPLASPFLKWAGGKTQLLGNVLQWLPERMETYFEPFIGGGAVFFALANEGRFRSAVIADANPELVETYRVVRDALEPLLEKLSEHQTHALDEHYYYQMRATDSKALSPIERAARLLYLNKTCFNGLYRVNKKGQFNVPFGRYPQPRVVNEAALRAASRALQGAVILNSDFEAVAAHAKAGDGIYFDPPYVPISTTSSFNSYHCQPFDDAEQARLLGVYQGCWARGVTAVLSNSDCDKTRQLYRGLWVETVYASRAINSVGSARGRITEVLVVGPQQVRATQPVLARVG